MSYDKKIYSLFIGGYFLIVPSIALAADSSSIGKWELLSLFEKGGAMMYPILFSSVLMLGIAIERGYSLRRNNIIMRGIHTYIHISMRAHILCACVMKIMIVKPRADWTITLFTLLDTFI